MIKKHIFSRRGAGPQLQLVGDMEKVHRVISIADTVEDKEIDCKLKHLGIKIVMLTGDNQGRPEAISNELGIDDYYAELLRKRKFGC